MVHRRLARLGVLGLCASLMACAWRARPVGADDDDDEDDRYKPECGGVFGREPSPWVLRAAELASEPLGGFVAVAAGVEVLADAAAARAAAGDPPGGEELVYLRVVEDLRDVVRVAGDLPAGVPLRAPAVAAAGYLPRAWLRPVYRVPRVVRPPDHTGAVLREGVALHIDPHDGWARLVPPLDRLPGAAPMGPDDVALSFELTAEPPTLSDPDGERTALGERAALDPAAVPRIFRTPIGPAGALRHDPCVHPLVVWRTPHGLRADLELPRVTLRVEIAEDDLVPAACPPAR
jgi:hypothetical protein